ncbi:MULTISPECIES: GNAT family N-acetyltransferase [unclassified Duganella]|uniref:GNAT family N-acetyltransferase n=1 Tax=unclassified Duganella TaxID=2636909 RepID=UPI000E348AB7|nr:MULTISPECIES: GNAT family protein [unclassified Duganella]RFP14931.1 N-acetyltransferase [Duganella sp. BJB475]RFP31281.1 N-acetyltransferase [Duganella sp. BJB476]
MNDILIRTLQPEDAAPLLQFELENRAWFEQHIAPRAQEFYTPQGVQLHIEQYLDGYINGTWHPCVMLNAQGRIVGRANLKDIDRHAASAEAGYRIASDQTGKGLATRALRHLIALADQQWQLRCLLAYVTDDNLASARVLRKCGFAQGQHLAGMEIIAGALRGGYQFVRLCP